MSDQDHLKYPNIKDFAQKASFEIARVQLASVITKFGATVVRTGIKESKKRWSRVMLEMYEKDNGMLRGYKIYEDGRNFRMFVEKVFARILDYVHLAKTTGNEVSNGILELSNIAEEFNSMKKVAEDNIKLRDENLKKRKEQMGEYEDEMGLIPKPANIEPVILENDILDTLNADCDDIDVDCHVVSVARPSSNKKQKVSCYKSVSSAKKLDFGNESVKKAKPNRNVKQIDFFDNQMPELDSMFVEMNKTLRELRNPSIPNTNNTRSTKIDELQKLLDLKRNLANEGYDTDVINEQINDLLKGMKK